MIKFNFFFLFALLFSFFFSFSNAEHIQYSIRRGQTPCRGVNLGGWLVLEHWMSYSEPLWQNVPDDIANNGELYTMRYLGHGADNLIRQHWDSWITESDIAEMAGFGINCVRVPVGYWIVGFDNSGGGATSDWQIFTQGGLQYLDTLIQNWAKKHNIAVIISLHGAKGSQNGNDHSSPPVAGKTYWSQYQENVQNTLDAVEFLARRYKDEEAFLGIGLVNEPGGDTNQAVLKQYYLDAYNRIRSFTDCVLLHMPFLWQQTNEYWSDFMPSYQNVWHEWHKYLIWGYESLDENGLRSVARGQLTDEVKGWTGNWLFIGEWSLAFSNTAKFNNDDDFKAFSNEYVSALSNAHSGWTYWSWRMSGDDQGYRQPWSLRNLLRRGEITIH